jgi:arylsulfatase A-like enzyme
LFVALTGPHMPDPTASMIADPDRRRTPAGLLPADSPRVLPDNADVLRRVREAGAREELAGITWLDDALAAVLDAVDDHGLADDTLIAYVIDHNDVGGKGSLYDAGARTKMALRGPGVSGRGRTNSLVANVDLPATLLDWCGIDPADTNMTIDGVSLRPILREPTSAVRDDLYLEIGLTRGLVTADGWKYIALRKPPEWQCETKGHLGLPEIYHMEGYTISHHPVHYFDADQLYDLNADPQERRNLARDRHATPANRARLAAMQARLREMLQPVPGPFGEFKEGA